MQTVLSQRLAWWVKFVQKKFWNIEKYFLLYTPSPPPPTHTRTHARTHTHTQTHTHTHTHTHTPRHPPKNLWNSFYYPHCHPQKWQKWSILILFLLFLHCIRFFLFSFFFILMHFFLFTLVLVLLSYMYFSLSLGDGSKCPKWVEISLSLSVPNFRQHLSSALFLTNYRFETSLNVL